MSNQRNLILAVVLTGLLLLGWDAAMRYFYPQPTSRSVPAAQAEAQPTREGGLRSPAAIAAERRDLATALSGGGRVAIDAPSLRGSINLTGAMVDDLTLARHRETMDEDSPPVRLFSPAGTPAQHFAQFGWVGEGVEAPGPATQWQADGARLTPTTPVTLSWSNGTGQTFAIRFAIDQNYMLSATQTVANRGGAPAVVRPFAVVNRTSRTASVDTWNVHSGPIGAFDGSVDFGNDYDDVAEARVVSPTGRPDWVGFTDIYWLSALVPDRRGSVEADFRALGGRLYRGDLIYQPASVAPGQQVTRTTRLFAGAKENAILERYEDEGITNLSLAIDWGWFRWFEKPIWYLLEWLFGLVGNFGVAIILLTFIVRGLMFPIAQRQFASMAQMRAIQPKMKALQERYKDDKQRQQQEIMALYKQEKVNPLAGCLPIFLQIPVFFALYKVLILSIDMRHQPFALWIRDLSVPEPAHFLNLFGLLPFEVPALLAIGPLALLLGVTMWLQFRLNPMPMDPAQETVFKIMPWILMFVMAPFAAGLLIYWTTSNILTIAQQKYLYSRHPQLRAQAQSAGNKDAGGDEPGGETEPPPARPSPPPPARSSRKAPPPASGGKKPRSNPSKPRARPR